jgi:Mg-chelatase subunit ChlD
MRPGGCTALLDAVGRTIDNMINQEGKTLVVILTDGLENSIKEYKLDQIKEKIKYRRDAGWEFIFLVANQGAWESGNSMGIAGAQTFNFDQTS